jgi:hypothetical protein
MGEIRAAYSVLVKSRKEQTILEAKDKWEDNTKINLTEILHLLFNPLKPKLV